MAFSGEFEHKLDGKFRLTVPASYRDQLEDGVVLVRGMDKCIDVYPPDEHERECEKADRASSGLQLQRTRQQILNAGVHSQLDPQGRITLPKGLRKWAGITQEVTVLGNRRTFRIWNPDAWDEFLDDKGKDYAEADVDLDSVGSGSRQLPNDSVGSGSRQLPNDSVGSGSRQLPNDAPAVSAPDGD